MFLRMVTHGESFPLSSINPSIIGEKMIARSHKVDDHHAARLIEVFSYIVKEDESVSGRKNYFFNGNENHILKDTDVFTPVAGKSDTGFTPIPFSPNPRRNPETLTVKEAGIDLVGNTVTFLKYRDKTGKLAKGEITGLVIGIYQSNDIYMVELDSKEKKRDALVIKVHANYQISV